MWIPQTEPSYPTPESMAWGAAMRKPTRKELFFGNIKLGFRMNTLSGALQARSMRTDYGPPEQETVALTAPEWKDSKFYREGLSYYDGMNTFSADVISRDFDRIQYQRYLNSKSKGMGHGILKFTGSMIGQIPDPTNFIGFLGVGAKILKVSPFTILTKMPSSPLTEKLLSKKAVTTSLGSILAKMPGVPLAKKALSKKAARNALEVAMATAAVQPALFYTYEGIGEEHTWQQVVTDIAFGAAFGAAFSLAGSTLKKTPEIKKLLVDDEYEQILAGARQEQTLTDLTSELEKIIGLEKSFKRDIHLKKVAERNVQVLISERKKVQALIKKINKIEKMAVKSSSQRAAKRKAVDELTTKQVEIYKYNEKIKHNLLEIKKNKTSIENNRSLLLKKKKKIKATLRKEKYKAINLKRELDVKIKKAEKTLTKELSEFETAQKQFKKTNVRKKVLQNQIGTFSATTQINGTKAFSSAVMDVIDGHSAQFSESGNQAVKDIAALSGAEVVVPDGRIPLVKTEPVKKTELGIIEQQPEMPEIRRKELGDEDVMELTAIEKDIKESKKMTDIMELADNCLTGKV